MKLAAVMAVSVVAAAELSAVRAIAPTWRLPAAPVALGAVAAAVQVARAASAAAVVVARA